MDKGGFINMKQLTHGQIFKWMEQWAPRTLAYEWDNVGLQVGSYNDPVKKIMVTLDISEAVVDEAINNGVNLIISHHPLLFKPLQQINVDAAKGRIVQKLLQHRITVYTSHTNLDIAPGGVNDVLCSHLKMNNTSPLVPVKNESLYKVIVFVPHSHAEDVRQALSEGGAGHIGHYSHCTFQTKGQGTFKPLEGTNPYIGKQDRLEFLDEYKIESIVKEQQLSTAIDAMIKSHPYEEVAYDIIPLANKGMTFGLGRIGNLHQPMTLKELCDHVKSAFKMTHVRVTGDVTKKVKRAAILGGSGEKYLTKAKHAGADVYITGDMSFHQAQLAEDIGLAVIDAGHYIEQAVTKAIQEKLQPKCVDKYIDVLVSNINTDPFQFM